MSLRLITAPADEPVTLADARLHLRVDDTDEDALIASLISAARARVEWYTGRALITQSWVLWCDRWPVSGIIEIPLAPLIRVQSLTLYGTDDSPLLMNGVQYRVDTVSAPGRVQMKGGFTPPVALRSLNAVALEFDAGYGDAAAVPAAFRQAILCIIADLYQHRGDEDEIIGLRARSLLAPYRVLR